jgi:AraC family transcriptional regulator
MRTETRTLWEERVLRVQRYIQDHLDEPLSLDTLAETAGFSRFHFSRIFSGITGESLTDYMRRLRLERAAFRLLYTEQSVTNLAFDAGYENAESFTRAFAQLYGVPPGRFRRRLREALDHRRTVLEPHGRTYSAMLAHHEGGISMNMTIEHFDSIRVAFLRHIGPYAASGAAWRRLCGNPAVQSRLTPESLFIGICYDDPDVTEADKIRMDVCVSVDASFIPEDGIEVQTIEGGEYARVIHKGSYDGLHGVYRALYGEWIPASGREPKGTPPLEIYLNDCTTPPEELLTEIRVPLR